jgi:hypothetical protein
MAYPEDYDELEGIDLGECALFSHVLTDGIIDTADEIEMTSSYCVFANYGSGDPLVSIIDPMTDKNLISGVEGEFLENAGIHKWCIDIPAKGEAGEDDDTEWKEGHVILKVYSEDSVLTFKKHVEVIVQSCSTADMCATMDAVIDTLADIENTETTQTETMMTMANGIKIRAIH